MTKVEDAFIRNPAELARLNQCALGELLQDLCPLVPAQYEKRSVAVSFAASNPYEDSNINSASLRGPTTRVFSE